MQYHTEQENFWAGEFGTEYITRNEGEQLITSNVVLFGTILKSAPHIKSIVELGCNIGLNLQALKRISRDFELSGYEINETAVSKARQVNVADVMCGTILGVLPSTKTHDLSFTKCVLIHIRPNELEKVYQNLYNLSHRYILVCEYYNPTPVTVSYRGNEERLFKRDFAGELIDMFDLGLIDYGFVYHRDHYFPQDDLSWFLLEKPNR